MAESWFSLSRDDQAEALEVAASLLDIRFPLPDPETQQHLVDSVATSREDAIAKRTEAAALRNSAWAAFESALFTPTEPSAA